MKIDSANVDHKVTGTFENTDPYKIYVSPDDLDKYTNENAQPAKNNNPAE